MKNFTNLITGETFTTKRIETRAIEVMGEKEALSGVVFSNTKDGSEKFYTNHQISKFIR